MNYKMIRYILSVFLRAEAAFMLLPFLVCLIYGGEAAAWFVVSSVVTLAASFLFGIKKPENDTIFAKESFVSVALGWLLLSIFGAVPFYISGAIPNAVDCFFETVSGFTTTGASILREVESLPKGILFWREFTHWIGGMGILVFILMLTQLSEGHSLYLMRAEVPGPSVGKLTPKSRSTATILYGIYAGMTALEAVLLIGGGMPVFDSVCYALGTAGTGGFGVTNAGLSSYANPYAEWVIATFMILFGVNFNLYYLMLLRKFKLAFGSEELHTYGGIVLVSSVLMGMSIRPIYGSFWETARMAYFHVAAIISTTGFTNADFTLWPNFSKTLILVLMVLGSCAGSTAGGIKISRVVIMAKVAKRNIFQLLHPHSVGTIKMEGKPIDRDTGDGVAIYISIFLFILFGSTLMVAIEGQPFETSFAATLSCFNNVGPGLGVNGPMGNYSNYSNATKLLLSMLMITGRLEIYPILSLLVPSFWKKH